MEKITTTNLSATTAPTTTEMLEMLNVDVLPFFDGYDEETFSFAENHRAVAVVSETENGFVISLNAGQEIEVSKAYFKFPGTEKEATLTSLKNSLS